MSTVDCSLYFRKIWPALMSIEPEPVNQTDCCLLPEVECRIDRITELKIFSQSLKGQIPEEIGQLEELEVLHLYRNSLGGNIPSTIGRLAKLKDLSLGGNLLQGELPPELGNLISLQVMYLDINKFTGRIPLSLGNLKNLQTLYLQNNLFTGPIPESVKQLNIRDLKFDDRNRDDFVDTNGTDISNPSSGSQNVGLVLVISAACIIMLCLLSALAFLILKKRKQEQLALLIDSKKQPQIHEISRQDSIVSFNFDLTANPIPPTLLNKKPKLILYFAQNYEALKHLTEICDYLFLQLNVKITAKYSYEPRLMDELLLNNNDEILVLKHSFDGWAYGQSLATGKLGEFPLVCTNPLYKTKVVLFKDILTNLDTRLDILKDAFSDNFKIETWNDFERYLNEDGICCYVVGDRNWIEQTSLGIMEKCHARGNEFEIIKLLI